MGRWMRAASLALVGTVGIFMVLMGVAIASYPGGTWIDPGHRGFHPWHNFLCDLLLATAINGEPSPVAAAASQVAMLVLIAGLGLLWLILPQLFHPRDRVPKGIVFVAGTVSAAGLVGVPLTTSIEHAWLHGTFIAAAGVPGFTACLVAVLGLLRSPRAPRWLTVLSSIAVLVAMIDFVLYLDHLACGTEVNPLLPALQKVATALILGWMLATGLFVWRSDGGSDGAAGLPSGVSHPESC